MTLKRLTLDCSYIVDTMDAKMVARATEALYQDIATMVRHSDLWTRFDDAPEATVADIPTFLLPHDTQ